MNFDWRNRMTGAVAIFLAALIVFFGVMYFMISELQAERTELDTKQTELQVLQRRLAAPVISKGASGAPVDPFIEGSNFALAANAMQQRVVGLIEAAGGTLVTVSIDPPVTANDETGRRVVVQAVAEMGNDGLQEMLYKLESEAPYVFVENLLIGRANTRDLSDSGGKAPQSSRLSVDLRVAGYFRKAGP